MAIEIKKSHKGLLHRDLGIPQDQSIPTAKLEAAKDSPIAAIRKRATFGANAKKFKH